MNIGALSSATNKTAETGSFCPNPPLERSAPSRFAETIASSIPPNAFQEQTAEPDARTQFFNRFEELCRAIAPEGPTCTTLRGNTEKTYGFLRDTTETVYQSLTRENAEDLYNRVVPESVSQAVKSGAEKTQETLGNIYESLNRENAEEFLKRAKEAASDPGKTATDLKDWVLNAGRQTGTQAKAAWNWTGKKVGSENRIFLTIIVALIAYRTFRSKPVIQTPQQVIYLPNKKIAFRDAIHENRNGLRDALYDAEMAEQRHPSKGAVYVPQIKGNVSSQELDRILRAHEFSRHDLS